MANRRMVSNAIVKSARFLKMPPTTQNLYFHLIMNADDDGVTEAFPIMRMVAATEDDLNILLEKSFIHVLNEDLVAYIDDWLEHNKVRSERKVDSIYKGLLLRVVPDIDYRESTRNRKQKKNVSDKCPSIDRHLSPEDRIGEGSIGEDSISKGSRGKASELSVKKIYDYYEQNGFGLISSKTMQDFEYWIKDFVEIGAKENDAIHLILYALGIAIDRNKRNYSYVNAILKAWEQYRYLSVEQVKAEDKKKKSNDDNRQWPDYNVGKQLENTGSSEYDNLF